VKNLIDSDWPEFHIHLRELIRMRNLIQFDKTLINVLTRYISEHEPLLNCTAYLEELLLVIDGPETIKAYEEFCRILYRIVSRTNLESEPALSFRASVNLQLLRFWAEQRGWSERRNIS
jgi:hypothetical protein